MSDARAIHLVKRGFVWVPADEYAEAFTNKTAENTEVMFTRHVSKASPKSMRRYFAMLKKVVEQDGVYKDVEELRSALLIATGYYTWKRDLYGRRYEHPESMAGWDEEKLQEHKRRAEKLIAEQLGYDVEELMRPYDGTTKWEGPIP